MSFDNTCIPSITHPMGRNWRQPDANKITFRNGNAWMDLKTFKDIPNYSGTTPTGVYVGKTWRRHDGVYDHRMNAPKPQWLLCWYDEHPSGDLDVCTIIYRPIKLTDALIEAQQ